MTRVVNRVLDLLDQRGLLLHTESQSKIGDLEVTPPLTYRQNVVKEIVTSERDYIQFLETLQNFRKELEEWGTVAGDVLHDIFLNLNALLDFQRRFLIRIEQQNSLPESQQNWGQLFIQYKDSFRVYEPFIANQLRCNNAVMREWDKIKSTPLSLQLRGIAEVPSVLMGFLLKPFQRLSKYPMLLEVGSRVFARVSVLNCCAGPTEEGWTRRRKETGSRRRNVSGYINPFPSKRSNR